MLVSTIDLCGVGLVGNWRWNLNIGGSWEVGHQNRDERLRSLPYPLITYYLTPVNYLMQVSRWTGLRLTWTCE